MSAIDALRRDLDGLDIEDHPKIVSQRSRDFFWYSPVLKEQLDHVTADLVVSPRTEAEVIEVLKTCYRHDVPVTPRGSGTGNYGQAMPLSRGVILHLAGMAQINELATGRMAAGPGTIMADIDKKARPETGQEIRMFPSTYNTATVGGFICGGSGGVGSINWGGLRDIGNILRLRIVTMEENPRVLDLSGYDVYKVMHAYGTNGIVTEVELPLTQSFDWVDVLVGFDDFLQAAGYCNELARQDGLLTKEIAAIAAPVPHDYFLRHRKYIRRDQSIAVLMVAAHAMDAFAAFHARRGGELLFRSDTAADLTGLPPAFELTWNHTTLRALRVDPAITYLQVLYPFPDHLQRIARMTEMFGDEVPGHLEFVRFNGDITCFGLPLVRYTTVERLEEIMAIHEAEGCPIFNPHRYTLEEGGMKQTDEVQLAFKREADPKGLLNPGKMIAWDAPDYDYRSGKLYLFPGLERF